MSETITGKVKGMHQASENPEGNFWNKVCDDDYLVRLDKRPEESLFQRIKYFLRWSFKDRDLSPYEIVICDEQPDFEEGDIVEFEIGSYKTEIDSLNGVKSASISTTSTEGDRSE